MTLLKIARMGHPVLLHPAEPVPDPTARDVRRLVEDMFETMEDAGGVGLAAPQIHVGKRIVVFKSPRDRSSEEADDSAFSPLTAVINPEFEVLTEDRALGWEGCLSVPGLTGAVSRATRIRYTGYNIQGQKIEREASGFHARVVQHEIDHLDGVLYTMRMTDLSLLSFNEELKYLVRPEAEAGEAS